MTEFFMYLACFILACFAVFQMALVLGAPLGRFAWGGAQNVLSNKLRIGSLVAILLYALFAIVLLDKAGAINIITNSSLGTIGMWIVTVYLFIGVIMNALSRSKAERLVMTPASLLLAVSFLIVAVG